MSYAEIAAVAASRASDEVFGPVVFTRKDGDTTTGKATGVPASGSPADGFQEGSLVRERARRLFLLRDGLTFIPKSGMTATWEGSPWNVLACSPLNPGGADLSDDQAELATSYRVILSR